MSTKKRNIGFRCDSDFKLAVDIAAAKSGKTLERLCLEALAAYLRIPVPEKKGRKAA